ncbi:hypothetical protein Tco_1534019 [Tanacetum coccineum]
MGDVGWCVCCSDDEPPLWVSELGDCFGCGIASIGFSGVRGLLWVVFLSDMNVGSKNIEEIRKNANKYVVLSEAVNDEELGDNVCQDDRMIVDRWDAINRENESSDEEDIIEELNSTQVLVADEIGGGDP